MCSGVRSSKIARRCGLPVARRRRNRATGRRPRPCGRPLASAGGRGTLGGLWMATESTTGDTSGVCGSCGLELEDSTREKGRPTTSWIRAGFECSWCGKKIEGAVYMCACLASEAGTSCGPPEGCDLASCLMTKPPLPLLLQVQRPRLLLCTAPVRGGHGDGAGSRSKRKKTKVPAALHHARCVL